MGIRDVKEYDLIKEEVLKGVKAKGYLLRHKKSGARVIYIENDDNNKVFSIGFRTPPDDSTGVPHILEHSVLCGSKNFPAKDPFTRGFRSRSSPRGRPSARARWSATTPRRKRARCGFSNSNSGTTASP